MSVISRNYQIDSVNYVDLLIAPLFGAERVYGKIRHLITY